MIKYCVSLCSVFLFTLCLFVNNSHSFVVQGLRCSENLTPGYTQATSFVLLRKQLEETTYTSIEENAQCTFSNQNIDDNSETCFQFASKNEYGVTVRATVKICVDPRKSPPSPPSSIVVD